MSIKTVGIRFDPIMPCKTTEPDGGTISFPIVVDNTEIVGVGIGLDIPIVSTSDGTCRYACMFRVLTPIAYLTNPPEPCGEPCEIGYLSYLQPGRYNLNDVLAWAKTFADRQELGIALIIASWQYDNGSYNWQSFRIESADLGEAHSPVVIVDENTIIESIEPEEPDAWNPNTWHTIVAVLPVWEDTGNELALAKLTIHDPEQFCQEHDNTLEGQPSPWVGLKPETILPTRNGYLTKLTLNPQEAANLIERIENWQIMVKPDMPPYVLRTYRFLGYTLI